MDTLRKATNTFDPDKDIPDLAGKVYVVTGGSAGIGYGIVAHLLQHNPERIYLLSNKEQHAIDAQEALKEWGDISKIAWVQCNLESFASTDAAAKQLSKELTRLDALICNAGLGVGVYSETEDGIDSHMQVNHFSQAHLIFSLLPVLQRTPESRLVLQSSDLHRAAPSSVRFASLDEINTDIGATYLYNRTKLAQVVFLRDMHRRLAAGQFGPASADAQGSSARVPHLLATHPGGVKTDQQDQAVEAYGTLGKVGVAAVRPFMKDPVASGCRPALFAATHGDVVAQGLSNLYVVPDRKVTEVSEQARKEELASNLWQLTKGVLEKGVKELGYTIPA